MRDSTIVTERTVSKYADLAEMLADENLTLRAELAGLRDDNAWLRELLSAAVDRLHAAHVDKLKTADRCRRLLRDLQALRDRPAVLATNRRAA